MKSNDPIFPAVKPIDILKKELLPTVMPCVNELLEIVKADKEYEVSFIYFYKDMLVTKSDIGTGKPLTVGYISFSNNLVILTKFLFSNGDVFRPFSAREVELHKLDGGVSLQKQPSSQS